jgi:hypothetical protein
MVTLALCSVDRLPGKPGAASGGPRGSAAGGVLEAPRVRLLTGIDRKLSRRGLAIASPGQSWSIPAHRDPRPTGACRLSSPAARGLPWLLRPAVQPEPIRASLAGRAPNAGSGHGSRGPRHAEPKPGRTEARGWVGLPAEPTPQPAAGTVPASSGLPQPSTCGGVTGIDHDLSRGVGRSLPQVNRGRFPPIETRAGPPPADCRTPGLGLGPGDSNRIARRGCAQAPPVASTGDRDPDPEADPAHR